MEIDDKEIMDSLEEFREYVEKGEQLHNSINVSKKLLRQKNSKDINFLRAAIVELTASKLLAKIHSEITLDVHSADMVMHLDACIVLIKKVIEEFNTDKRYIKEVDALMSYINADGDPLKYLESVLDLLNSIYSKEENLENHANTVMETTSYAIQGVNCYVPNYTCNESEKHNKIISSEIEALKLIQKPNK